MFGPVEPAQNRVRIVLDVLSNTYTPEGAVLFLNSQRSQAEDYRSRLAEAPLTDASKSDMEDRITSLIAFFDELISLIRKISDATDFDSADLADRVALLETAMALLSEAHSQLAADGKFTVTLIDRCKMHPLYSGVLAPKLALLKNRFMQPATTVAEVHERLFEPYAKPRYKVLLEATYIDPVLSACGPTHFSTGAPLEPLEATKVPSSTAVGTAQRRVGI